MGKNAQAKEPKANRKGFMTTGGERFSYGLYFVGQNIFYIFIYLYVSTYLLDQGISAYAVAAALLVVKIWDAVNDPIFGGIVDRVKFKKGKFLPWLKISLIFIPITTVLMFAIPSGIPMGAKIAWAIISYMLWDTAYTICDVPIFGIITTMTDNQQERTSLMSTGRVAAMVASMIVYMGVPKFREAIGGWLPTIAVLSVIALITMIPICLKAKERIAPAEGEKEVGIGEMFRYIGKNRYLLIFYLALFIGYSANIASTIGLIFARECLGSEEAQSVISLASFVPSIVMGILIPTLVKKIDKYKLYVFSIIASAVLGIIMFFAGYQNFTVFMVLNFLRGIPLGIWSMTMFMFTPDCAEYGHFKTGTCATGITFAIQTFSVKLMTAVSTALGTLCLGLIGYVEGEGAVQVAGFADRLWRIYSLVPSIGLIITVPLLFMYKLTDKDVAIMAKANAGEISKEEAANLINPAIK